MKSKAYTSALKHGYKSGLEDNVSEQLKSLGYIPNYEKIRIGYTAPSSHHTYTPDFCATKPGMSSLDGLTLINQGKLIIIETKGRFLLSDRKKHILIKQQYPKLDLRFVFTNSKAKISKTSKTTYGMWCDKEGFKYADKLIPAEWLKDIK